MRSALMEEVRGRHAPGSIYVLWRAASTETSSERFAREVAWRWEETAAAFLESLASLKEEDSGAGAPKEERRKKKSGRLGRGAQFPSTRPGKKRASPARPIRSGKTSPPARSSIRGGGLAARRGAEPEDPGSAEASSCLPAGNSRSPWTQESTGSPSLRHGEAGAGRPPDPGRSIPSVWPSVEPSVWRRLESFHAEDAPLLPGEAVRTASSPLEPESRQDLVQEPSFRDRDRLTEEAPADGSLKACLRLEKRREDALRAWEETGF